MNNFPKILVLYAEVMGYTEAWLKSMVQDFSCQVNVVKWDKGKLTPLENKNHTGIEYRLRSSFSKDEDLLDYAKRCKPDLVYASGRMDKGYLKVVKHFRKQNIPTLSGMDNQWFGSLRQKIAIIFSYYLYRQYFTHIQVPNRLQYEYARRLGYAKEKIFLPLYTADTKKFASAYTFRKNNENQIEKTILFVGRLHPVKGLQLLIDAFVSLREKHNQWELKIIGSGPLKEKISKDIKQYPEIILHDFLQPEELVIEAREAAFFCLPSLKEPWGVVIHEFACLGLPLLTSSICGASSQFLVNGYNGYTFSVGSKTDLIEKLDKMMSKSEIELAKMGQRSHALSKQISPELTAAATLSIINL